MDLDQINEIHRKQVEDFCESIEKIKDREKEVVALIAQLKELKAETDQKLIKIKADSEETEKLKKETAKAYEIAEKAQMIAESRDKARKEVLEHLKVDEAKVAKEGKLLEKQYKELEEAKKRLTSRERFVVIEEDRLKRLRAKVDTLVEANKLKDIVYVGG